MMNHHSTRKQAYLHSNHLKGINADLVRALQMDESAVLEQEKALPLSDKKTVEGRLSLAELGILLSTVLWMGWSLQSLGYGGKINLLNWLSVNMVCACLFSLVLRFNDLSDGFYSLGKCGLMGFLLWTINLALAFTSDNILHPIETGFITGTLAGLSGLSGVLHYKISQPFRKQDNENFYYKLEITLKRCTDWVIAALGIIAISPLLAMVVVLLCLEKQGAPLYRQIRIGKHEKPFFMYKFRSMVQNAESLPQRHETVLFKQQDDPRITPLGKLIRKLSVDELPQLWNVLRGEMSLVGPRPPIQQEYEQMNRYHRRKFEAMPGLTGLWQVAGRVKNQRDFNSVAAYDVFYIENWCLIQDIKILLKTIPVVLFQRGAF